MNNSRQQFHPEGDPGVSGGGRRAKRSVKKGPDPKRTYIIIGAIAGVCVLAIGIFLGTNMSKPDDGKGHVRDTRVKPSPPTSNSTNPNTDGGGNGKNPKPNGGGNGKNPKPNGGGNGKPATTTDMLDELQGKKVYIAFANPQQEIGGLNSLAEDDPLFKLSNALKVHRDNNPVTDYTAAQFSLGKINGPPNPIKADGSSFHLGDRMVMRQATGAQALLVPYAPYAIKPGLLYVFPKAGVEPKPFQEFVILVTGGTDGVMQLSKGSLKFDDNQKTVTVNKDVEEKINKMLSSATGLGINLTPVLGGNDGTPNMEVDFKPYAQQQILALDRQVKNLGNRKELCKHAVNAFSKLIYEYRKGRTIAIDPTTGLPVGGTIDPTTGLPVGGRTIQSASVRKATTQIKQTLLGYVTRLRLSNQDQFSQGIAQAAQYCNDAPTADKHLKAYNKELSRLEGFDLKEEKAKWSGDAEWNKLKRGAIFLFLNGGNASFIKFE